jgi:predicted enzyme related to lactoylglutathione lyase
MKNALNWFEIPVSDFSRAKTFYETIMDWKLQEMTMGPLTMGFFPADDGGTSGAIVMGPDLKPSMDGTMVYLNADGILDDVITRIPGAGGKVIQGKHLITEEYGHMAIFADTEGNKVALHAPMRK